MSTITTKTIKSILSSVATALEINDWKYEQSHFKDKAQNYFGVLIPITLCGKHGENNVKIQIVLKMAPSDERYRVSGAVTIMFAREIFVYTKVLDKYQNIQSSYSSPSQLVIPKLFYTCKEYCKEALVIENMCEKGYLPYLHSMFLDLDHVKVAIQSLAQLHALSLVLRERHEKLYEEISDTCVPLTEKTNKRFMEILINRLEKALGNFKNTVYEPLLSHLKLNCTKLIESASTSVKSLCICHGDIWKENILFQYMEDKPISACLIDYQTTRLSSPAFDVLYLIVSSTNAPLRQQSFYQLLDIYYEGFTNTLNLENIDTKLYSREMFDYDLKIVGPACFIVANTALWLSNGLQHEGHVRSIQRLSTEEEKLTALNKYKDIIKDILDDLTSYGYMEITL